ncbi:hypothetical protein SDC9_158851 [bioreactor metagenome]|uniref:Uncharacterized protein n=1 Tax=bioreactor metagenome TaxID=1076179 RepID=A0A645FB07_9ZZZZ
MLSIIYDLPRGPSFIPSVILDRTSTSWVEYKTPIISSPFTIGTAKVMISFPSTLLVTGSDMFFIPFIASLKYSLSPTYSLIPSVVTAFPNISVMLILAKPFLFASFINDLILSSGKAFGSFISSSAAMVSITSRLPFKLLPTALEPRSAISVRDSEMFSTIVLEAK